MKKLCALTALMVTVVTPVSAFTYVDGDMLLVFRRSGFNDVEFNVGTVSNYLGQAAGSKIAVTNWNPAQVKANFNNSLSGVSMILLAATSATDPERRLWLLSGSSAAPTDLSGSKWGQLRSKIDFVGAQARANTETNNVQTYTVSANLESSYSSIASDGGRLEAATLAGLSPVPVEAAIPATADFYEVKVNNSNPKPASLKVGAFSIGLDGVLTFTAAGGGTVEPITPPVLAIARTGGLSTISFQSMQGVVYRLRYIADTGLGSPLGSWLTLGSATPGNGGSLSLQDASAELDRFYAVEAFRQ